MVGKRKRINNRNIDAWRRTDKFLSNFFFFLLLYVFVNFILGYGWTQFCELSLINCEYIYIDIAHCLRTFLTIFIMSLMSEEMVKPEQPLELIYIVHIYQNENYVSEKRKVSSTANHSNNARSKIPAPKRTMGRAKSDGTKKTTRSTEDRARSGWHTSECCVKNIDAKHRDNATHTHNTHTHPLTNWSLIMANWISLITFCCNRSLCYGFCSFVYAQLDGACSLEHCVR